MIELQRLIKSRKRQRRGDVFVMLLNDGKGYVAGRFGARDVYDSRDGLLIEVYKPRFAARQRFRWIGWVRPRAFIL